MLAVKLTRKAAPRVSGLRMGLRTPEQRAAYAGAKDTFDPPPPRRTPEQRAAYSGAKDIVPNKNRFERLLDYSEEIFQKASKMKPGELLKKYGVAYLLTSISLSLVSFTLCFTVVSKGIGLAGILARLGIAVS